MAMPFCQLFGNTLAPQGIVTNKFVYYNTGYPGISPTPDADYWGVAASDIHGTNYGIELKPGKSYLVNLNHVWDVQGAGKREAAIVVSHTFTDPADNFEDEYRLGTQPGDSKAFVELSGSVIVQTLFQNNENLTSIHLFGRAWQNSGYTVALTSGTLLSALELDI